jgi:hypothetical protein
VTVESNKAAGGVTWRWFWNGMQFENHFGFGGETPPYAVKAK